MGEWLRVLTERRDIVMTMIAATDGLEVDRPDDAFYVFADCSGLIGRFLTNGRRIEGDLDLVGSLLDEAEVGPVHGSAFGMPNHLRIAYAVETARRRAAVAAISATCSRLERRRAA